MDSTSLAIRFGFGLPATATDPEDLIGPLAGADEALARWPGVGLDEAAPAVEAYRVARKAKDSAGIKQKQNAIDMLAMKAAKAVFARAVGSSDPFRERLVAFWTDHFTVVARNRVERHLSGALIDEAIRPHVGGRFNEMLRAVITHPAMLVYLNQEASFGPNSYRGKRQAKGLNENLARELMELHTLGVGAGYSQADVRELAELLTGLTVAKGRGFVFDPKLAEPGAETVLGVTYSGKGVAPVLQALDDLAARPETAAHIARKLAIHFVADTPEPALVAALEGVFRDTGGDLLAVSRALVLHPTKGAAGKARQPFDFVVASLRALGVSASDILALHPKAFRRLVLQPLEAMGQPFQQAPGPNGWPEEARDWISPQGLAARIDWAMKAPAQLVRPLPDPRAFLVTALGPRAGEKLTWAVSAAESARDGVGLVLASPEFNRR